jgi:hypothetical protein
MLFKQKLNLFCFNYFFFSRPDPDVIDGEVQLTSGHDDFVVVTRNDVDASNDVKVAETDMTSQQKPNDGYTW